MQDLCPAQLWPRTCSTSVSAAQRVAARSSQLCAPVAITGRRRRVGDVAGAQCMPVCSCSCQGHGVSAAVISGHALFDQQQQQQQQQHHHHHHHTAVSAAAPEAGVSASPEAVCRRQQQHEAHLTAIQRPPLPFAALTRLLLTGQNSYYFRNALTQRRAGGGPISLLLFVLTLVAAVIAAVRGALVRKVKSCRMCRGFGVTRCRLCNGEGRVDWAAKLSHTDMCPLCMNRRYVVCSECGGFYHRPLFSHMRRGAKPPQVVSEVYGMAVDDAGTQFMGRSSFSIQETLGSSRND